MIADHRKQEIKGLFFFPVTFFNLFVLIGV